MKAEVFGQLQQDARSAVFLGTQDAESVRITDRLNLIPKGGLQEPELLKRALHTGIADRSNKVAKPSIPEGCAPG